jgi:putative aminopeptidase FrvX
LFIDFQTKILLKKMEKNTEFLYKYLNNASPTGFEYPGQQIWLDYIRPFIDETIIDDYGTAVGVINPGKEYSVAIEAHADEISWFVNYITPEGYIYVIRNGGSDHQIAPSMRVNLHTRKNGIVKGIFGWPAIHVRSSTSELPPKLDNIFIDIGAENKEEVENMGVVPGTVITFEDGLTELNGKFFTGRALDNRMGGYIIAEVARRLKENKKELPFTLYVVNSVQEEIGLRGAEMISRRLKPNVAIITDVTHDTQSPMYDKKKSGDIACGKGPSLTRGPAVQNNLLNFILDIAEDKKIPVQLSASSRATGTDTDAFAFSSEGVPSALISLPLKYMHTTVETCHKDDIQACIDLYYEVLMKLEAGQSFKYLK